VTPTLADLVPNAAARWPDRELFRFGDTRCSYGEFERWTHALATDLVRRGVRPGDKVLVQLPNRLEALAVQVAAFRAGALDVPVVPIYRAHEMRQILADCRPSVVCSIARLGERTPADELDALLGELGLAPTVRYLVDGSRPGWTTLPDRTAESARGVTLPTPPGPDEPVLLLYTSGTTSAPKGALLSSRAVYAHLKNFRDALGVDENTVTLTATPLSHLSGFVAAVVFPAFLGGRSVIMPSWRPDEAVELIEAQRVTLMMGATVFITDLLARYERTPADGHRLSVYAAAGATLAPEVVDRASAAGVNVVRAYGMTETAGVCAIASANDPLALRRAWDGRRLPGMEIEVVDDDRVPIAAGEIGHLRIRGPQLLTGYTDARLSEEQLDRDGWFYPGDLGQVDEHGWVRVAGRTKDIVNRGGEKFSTLDIEQAIGSHPGVAAVAATAIADERFGEAVGAWLVPSNASITAEMLLAHLDGRGLARQKLPVEWHLVTELPVTASGKVQKYRLSQLTDLQTWKTPPEGTHA
jgi:acyl-CoA synthetase (AMP-forming)/AMP-acid ligase II